MPPETLTHHSLDELLKLSLEDLEALWELVPTDRQRRYQDRLALGYAENPPGPWQSAAGWRDTPLLPGQVADVALHWSWSGEPFGALQVLGGVFSIAI